MLLYCLRRSACCDLTSSTPQERVQGILPGLMDEAGVEFWVLSQKEYGEDICWRAVTSAEQQVNINHQMHPDMVARFARDYVRIAGSCRAF
eukprot:SAG11_NODE_1993_length_3953_cov_3.205501_2_plen_91_part_00